MYVVKYLLAPRVIMCVVKYLLALRVYSCLQLNIFWHRVCVHVFS
jgi:hypothetical protein